MARTRSADPPNGLAPLLRVRPELQDYCRFGGDWRAPHDAINAAQFHIVTRGQCVIERPGLGHIRLSKGDILLLPHGNAHIVRAAKADGQAPRPIMVDYSSAIRSKTTEGVEPETEIVCGVLRFESATENYIASTLPNIVVLHSCEGPVVDRFRMIMLGIRGELDGSRPGGIVIATDFGLRTFRYDVARVSRGAFGAGTGRATYVRFARRRCGYLSHHNNSLSQANCWRCNICRGACASGLRSTR